MQDYEKLRVWQESDDLARKIFVLADRIPGPRRFILGDQLCRAALSVPANIVEGVARNTDREVARFLDISAGSAAELDFHLRFLNGLDLLPASDILPLRNQTNSVRRMLNAFRSRLRDISTSSRVPSSPGPKANG